MTWQEKKIILCFKVKKSECTKQKITICNFATFKGKLKNATVRIQETISFT